MICQRMMMVGSGAHEAETWSFTVNTEATAEGEKKTGIPFNLYGCDGAYIDVNWGDGTNASLQPSNYASDNSTASVHEYAEPGEYQVTIKSKVWNKVKILAIENTAVITSITNANAPLYWWRRTIVSIDNPLPTLNGKNYYTQYNNATLRNRTDNFSFLFSHCNKLQSVSEGLLDNNTAATRFESCFHNCSSLASIPSGLFDKNIAVTNFYGCFRGCTSLQSIPSKLFDKNTVANSFSYCFRNCSSLASIPVGLFDSNTAVTSFDHCFSDCYSLQSIPSGLFDKNTAATNFDHCFYCCRPLQSIPAGLFDHNTAVTTFQYCFYGCTSLQSIPSGLFNNNTTATNFQWCFYGCTSLQSIPSGLFDHNTAVTDFSYCFQSCSSIQSIPSGLFDKNTVATNFSYCFNSCTLLANFDLHVASPNVSSAGSFVTKKTGAIRNIYVPNASTTQTTFNGVASSLGLTIIGE